MKCAGIIRPLQIGVVDQFGAFASEVTRVARKAGTDGKLGGQAEVEDVSGTWKDSTDDVNVTAGNLTMQVRNIAAVTPWKPTIRSRTC